MDEEIFEGKISRWFDGSGYGFIKAIPATFGKKDVFAHTSDFVEDSKPYEGMKVTFQMGMSRDGKSKAVNISRIE